MEIVIENLPKELDSQREVASIKKEVKKVGKKMKDGDVSGTTYSHLELQAQTESPYAKPYTVTIFKNGDVCYVRFCANLQG